MTAIEWTDATWNPVTGCTKVSQGCKNCYAEGGGPARTRVPSRGSGRPGMTHQMTFDEVRVVESKKRRRAKR